MKRDPWTETAAPADGVLRFMTCGSVDDGKSTLIGRLLFDTRALLSDTLATMQRHAQRQGLSAPDLALLTDGLIAEREQGITIDVAYRYFATARRKFVIADSPGHEQYTRNMVTAASTADAAVLLVDARKGLLAQTRRHAALAALLGVRHLVLAVNKMDLVGHAQPVFEAIVAEFRAWLAGHGGLAGERELGRAHAGQSVMVWLADERDVSRGDLIVRADEPPVAVLESFTATVCWLSARPLKPGITWQLRHGTRELKGRVEAVEHLLDVQTLRWAGAPAAATLQLNDIGRLRLRTQPLPAQPYGELRAGGSFILVDPATRETVAAGWID